MNLGPGIYDLTKEQYEADPVEGGSLRASTAWLLVQKGACPKKAWAQMPKLNPKYRRKNTRFFDLGSAFHKEILRKGGEIVRIEGRDYSRNEKKGLKKSEKGKLRDKAYAEGKIPLILPEQERVADMVEAAKEQLADMVNAGELPYMPFAEGDTERTIIWEDHGVMCRSMIDCLPHDGEFIDELKTDGESAHPDQWHWKLRKYGYAFRTAFYRRGLQTLSKQGLLEPQIFSPQHRFFVVETEPPHLMAWHFLSDDMLAEMDKKVQKAIKIYQHCWNTGHWPGYALSGYEVDLTERERMAEQQVPHGGHEFSEDTAAKLNTPSRLFRNERA